MNVKIAAQTLSSSVADAIQYLMEVGHPDCVDATGTIRFIRVIDQLFDLLNSRSPYAKGFKKALFNNDSSRWKSTINETTKYLSELTVQSTGVSILKHRRKTFALGLITAALSVNSLAQRLFSSNHSFKYLLTYKLSQDHLELLFACIRGKNGFNNNPDIRQFKSSLKKILMRNSIIGSNKANCLIFEDHSNGSVFSLKWNKRNAPLLEPEIVTHLDQQEINLLSDRINSTVTSVYQDAILGYIAGFIVRKILKRISCVQCSESLLHNLPNLHNDHGYGRYILPSLSLINSKNRGGLIIPSKSVVDIVIKSDKAFRIYIGTKSKMNKHTMLNMIYSSIISTNLFSELADHDKENEQINEDMHSSQLIKKIIKKFLKLRLFAYTKQYNKDILHKDSIGKRQQSTKLVLFSGI